MGGILDWRFAQSSQVRCPRAYLQNHHYHATAYRLEEEPGRAVF